MGHGNYEETLPKTTCEKEKVEIKQKEKVIHTPRAIVRHGNSSEKKKIQSLRLYKEIVKKERLTATGQCKLCTTIRNSIKQSFNTQPCTVVLAINHDMIEKNKGHSLTGLHFGLTWPIKEVCISIQQQKQTKNKQKKPKVLQPKKKCIGLTFMIWVIHLKEKGQIYIKRRETLTLWS